MSVLSDELEKFINSTHTRPSWYQHIPNSICTHIETLSDFMTFVKFLSEHTTTQFIEYRCEDTAEFLEALANLADDEDAAMVCKKHNIRSEFGILAYKMVIALGNT